MNQKISIAEINNTVDIICESEEFKKSPRNTKLLKFLVQKSVASEFIKEQVIGFELFNTTYNPQKNDTKVRVYVYNLRKKLADYYQEHGSDDEIILEIKKGQYNVSFNYRKDIQKKKSSRKKKFILVFFLFLILFTLSTITIYRNRKNNLFCWKSFFEKETQTVCILSDHKMFYGSLPDGSLGLLRNPEVNTEKELIEYLQNNQKDNFQKSNFTFLTKMAPIAIQDLTQWFQFFHKDFEILTESEYSFENIRDKNVIIVGQSKTMDKSKSFLLKKSERFHIDKESVNYKNNNSQTLNYSNRNTIVSRIDYAIVSFIPLGDIREALVFTSNNDIGVIASLKQFTNQKWLSEFHKDFPDSAKYFHALIKVTGVGRTELSFKIEQTEFLYFKD